MKEKRKNNLLIYLGMLVVAIYLTRAHHLDRDDVFQN